MTIKRMCEYVKTVKAHTVRSMKILKIKVQRKVGKSMRGKR